MRYIGRTVKGDLKRDGTYTYIALNTITRVDGLPHDLETDKDVYVHVNGMDDAKLQPNLEVTFEVATDTRRGDAFRANHVAESMGSQLARLGAGGIQLLPQATPDADSLVLESSMIFMTWCYEEALRNQISVLNRKGLAVRLLFVYWKIENEQIGYHTSHREERYLVDVTEPMVLLPFNASGEHRIVAYLVWDSTIDKLVDSLLSRGRYTYHADVISSNGCRLLVDESDSDRIAGRCGSGCIQVEVPKQLFAEKPRDWDWVSRWWKDKSHDECSFRKRRVLAYTIQPPCVFGWWVIRRLGTAAWRIIILLLVVICALVGVRGMNLKDLRQPFSKAWELFDRVFEEAETSWFMPTIWGVPRLFPLMVSPLFLLLATGIVLFFSGWSWWSLVFTVGAIGAVLVVIDILFHGFRVIETADFKERIRLRQARQFDAIIQEHSCDTTDGPPVPDVWRVRGVQTFRFFALGIKQLVCKEFSVS